ncbi:MAG TPA: N-6 DNA methylase [Phycisphaerae bacterium]|nr:N-6 DNA methylase [Phycisphaerae bacterium]
MSERGQKPGGSRRRRLGQVFTPRPVANWMAKWACAGRPRNVLDPAVGAGVFLHGIHKAFARRRSAGLPSPRVEAVDIDAGILQACGTRKVPGLDVRFRRADFLTAEFPIQYDAIVANPPYLRHHEHKYGERVFRRFDAICGRRLSRLTNSYGLFLLRICELLRETGRAAIITPVEWLNADFGRVLKRHFLERNALDGVVQFAHASKVFDGAMTTAAITLLRRDRAAGAPIRFATVEAAEELEGALTNAPTSYLPSALDSNLKWSPLFVSVSMRTAKRISFQKRPTTCRVGDIASCVRGIATGANGYFTMRASDRRRWGVDPADLAVCVTKARQLSAARLTSVEINELIQRDERVYLLKPRERLNRPLRKYLEQGEKLGIARRYLPSHRPVWYRPEARPPAPILVSVFSRGAFRFVRNEAGVLNLTAYHGIYPRCDDPMLIGRLFDYLNSDAAQEALKEHRRVYAEGLFKVEPRDVEAMRIPDRLAACFQTRPNQGSAVTASRNS